MSRKTLSRDLKQKATRIPEYVLILTTGQILATLAGPSLPTLPDYHRLGWREHGMWLPEPSAERMQLLARGAGGPSCGLRFRVDRVSHMGRAGSHRWAVRAHQPAPCLQREGVGATPGPVYPGFDF